MTKTNIGPTVAALTDAEIGRLKALCKEFEPDRAIDIGTYRGGSACIMQEMGVEKITSYDVRDCNPPVLPGIEYVRGNVFRRPTAQRIIDDCKAPGRVLLFCDGGCKPGEILCFAPNLKPGDVVAGHDFHDEGDDGKEGFALNVVEPLLSQIGFRYLGCVERMVSWVKE